MESPDIVRIRTNCQRGYKACVGEFGCKRPVLPTYGLCRVHHMRKVRQGCVAARSPLRPRQRRPYTQAVFAWFKERIRAKDTGVLQALSEFDSFLRLRCERIHLGDLGRRRVNSHRKMQGMLSNILKRWPNEHQASIAILSVILATRLACRVEPGVPGHPAFVRAMQVQAVYSLVRRKNMKTWKTHRPQLNGRWLAKRLDDAVSPFLRFMCPSAKDRDNAILAKVATHQYIKVRWESLSTKTLKPHYQRPGHPCPWKGKPAPKKGDKYDVN